MCEDDAAKWAPLCIVSKFPEFATNNWKSHSVFLHIRFNYRQAVRSEDAEVVNSV